MSTDEGDDQHDPNDVANHDEGIAAAPWVSDNAGLITDGIIQAAAGGAATSAFKYVKTQVTERRKEASADEKRARVAYSKDEPEEHQSSPDDDNDG